MKFCSFVAACLPLALGAMYSKDEYDTGAVMAKMMEAKEVHSSQNVSLQLEAEMFLVYLGRA